MPCVPDGAVKCAVQRTPSHDEVLKDYPSQFKSASKVACVASFDIAFVVEFLIPRPMFLTHYIFSKGFSVAWVIISFV